MDSIAAKVRGARQAIERALTVPAISRNSLALDRQFDHPRCSSDRIHRHHSSKYSEKGVLCFCNHPWIKISLNSSEVSKILNIP